MVRVRRCLERWLLVLGVGVSSQAPFDQRRIDAERIPVSGQFGDRYLAVGRAEAMGCGPLVGELG